MAGVENQIITQLTTQASDLQIMKREVEKLVTFEKSVEEKINAVQRVSEMVATQSETIKTAVETIKATADGVGTRIDAVETGAKSLTDKQDVDRTGLRSELDYHKQIMDTISKRIDEKQ